MNDKIIDTNFGIGNQPLAIINYMKDFTPEFANYKNGFFTDVSFTTLPWYNGREKGIVISMSIYYEKNIHIAFFEHRNSDAIHCLKWETNRPYYNHPLEDPKIFDIAYSNDSKWDTAKSFPVGEIGNCADWICDKFKNFYTSQKKEAK